MLLLYQVKGCTFATINTSLLGEQWHGICMSEIETDTFNGLVGPLKGCLLEFKMYLQISLEGILRSRVKSIIKTSRTTHVPKLHSLQCNKKHANNNIFILCTRNKNNYLHCLSTHTGISNVTSVDNLVLFRNYGRDEVLSGSVSQ